MGRHDDEQTLLRVDEAINKTYTRRNGAEMSVSRICWDIGVRPRPLCMTGSKSSAVPGDPH